LEVISEVTDGLEAVQKAKQLQPDLVLLDIGLPTLNGIEAARQIRTISSNTKVLFVSQESSADIVQAAVSTGARGYVLKIDAGRELFGALETVLRGGRYLSASVAEHHIPETSSSHVSVDEHKLFPTQPPVRNEKIWYHEVGFYADDRSLWNARIDCITSALQNGNAAVLVASDRHQNEVLSRLQSHGVDVQTAIERGRYIP